MADLRPFQPGEYIANADGTISTERSRTVMILDECKTA